MPGRIDKIKLVHLAVHSCVIQGHTLRLDRNAALALQIHRIENLLCHFALSQTATVLNKSISQCRLPMIDVRDDRKIAYVTEISQDGFASKYEARQKAGHKNRPILAR